VHQNHEIIYTTRKLSSQEVGSMKAKNDSGTIKYDGNWVELIPEAKQNIALVPVDQYLNIWAATWMIDRKGRLGRRRLTLTPAYWYYQLKCVVPVYWPAFGKMFRWIISVAKALLHCLDLRKYLRTAKRL
jgi:hypothetical protein